MTVLIMGTPTDPYCLEPLPYFGFSLYKWVQKSSGVSGSGGPWGSFIVGSAVSKKNGWNQHRLVASSKHVYWK